MVSWMGLGKPVISAGMADDGFDAQKPNEQNMKGFREILPCLQTPAALVHPKRDHAGSDVYGCTVWQHNLEPATGRDTHHFINVAGIGFANDGRLHRGFRPQVSLAVVGHQNSTLAGVD